MVHQTPAVPRRDTPVPPAPPTHRPAVDPQPSPPDLDFPSPPDLEPGEPDISFPPPALDPEAQRLPWEAAWTPADTAAANDGDPTGEAA